MTRQWKYVKAKASEFANQAAHIPLDTRRKRKISARRAAALGYTPRIMPASLLHSYGSRDSLYKAVLVELRAVRIHKCMAYMPMSMRRWLNKQPN